MSNSRPDHPEPPIGSAAWIDAMLRARLGPGATTGAITFEGRILRIEGARLPLGPLRLDVERADVELGAGLPLGELPLAARLVSLRAVIHAGGVAVPVELSAGDPAAPSWFSGTVRARAEAPRAIALTASLDVAPAGATLRDGRVTAGALSLSLSGALQHAAGAFAGDLLVAGAQSRLALALTLDAAGRADGSRLTGRVAVGDLLALGLSTGEVAPGPEAVIELDLAAHGALADLALRGRVFSPVLLLGRRAHPPSVSAAPALRLDAVRATVDLTRRRLRYQDLRGDAHGARFAGWGRVPFTGGAEAVPLAAIAVEGAGYALVRVIAALAGAPVRVPTDLSVTGELMLAPSLAASGTFAVETPRTQLLFKLALGPAGDLVGSTLRGRLAASDAVTLGIFSEPVAPRAPAVLDVDGRLTGTLLRPGITGRASCARFLLGVSADAAAPAFLVEDASALLDVDAERFAWHRFTGRFYGGSFSSSGAAAYATGVEAALGWSGVRVELLPTHASGENRLASLLHGASSGELRFEGRGDAPVGARGQLALSGPLYLVTRALAPRLDRYGLPRVRSRGRGPLSARLRFEGGVLHVESLAAAVEGVELAGDVRLGLDGAIGGTVVVHLLEAYLGQSALLAIPAALAGRVTVPVELGGTVSAPEIRTDGWQILEALLTRNRVGDAVKSVIDGLRGSTPKRR
jgi:hypothetical protein